VRVRALLGRLGDGGPVPLVVFDAGYDSAQLTLDLAEQRVAVLVRLRSDRCFYADPPPPAPGATGRPRRHGAKFNCADPTTWPAPTATLVCEDDQYGSVTVQAWAGLHPKQQRHPGHGSGGPRPIVRGTILRVQVERVPAKTRPPKVLWLWWAGPGTLDLDLAWRAYIRRFDLEIVCTQVTKPRLGAAGGGGDHVADLDLAVGHHHPVDQQLDQLAALLEAGLAQAHPELLQRLGHRLGDRADLDQPLALGGDLPLAGQQVGLLPGKAPVLPLEAGQVDGLGQIRLQQPLALAVTLARTWRRVACRRRSSWGTQAPLWARSSAWVTSSGCCRTAHRSTHTSSSSWVAGMNRAGQQLERPELTRACLPRQR
jgi:hypothetical protein